MGLKTHTFPAQQMHHEVAEALKKPRTFITHNVHAVLFSPGESERTVKRHNTHIHC